MAVGSRAAGTAEGLAINRARPGGWQRGWRKSNDGGLALVGAHVGGSQPRDGGAALVESEEDRIASVVGGRCGAAVDSQGGTRDGGDLHPLAADQDYVIVAGRRSGDGKDGIDD